MKKNFFLGAAIFILSLVIWSCMKDLDESVQEAVSPQKSTWTATERTACTGTCSFRIKINSVSPAGSGWIFSAVANGSLLFVSDDINVTCDLNGTQNNSLGTWYYFTAPECEDITLTLGTLLNKTTCADVNGSINFTLESYTGGVTIDQISASIPRGSNVVYNTNSNCEISKCGFDCDYRIKITSVSPALSGWRLRVTSNGGSRFESDNISTTCDADGTLKNTLNTWYTFRAPACDSLHVTLESLVNTTTCAAVSGSVNYIIESVSGTGTHSASVSLPGGATDAYATDPFCNL